MILLDTHVLVWLATGDPRLPEAFRERVAGGEAMSTSAVIAFEYEELHRRGRLGAGPTFATVVDLLGLKVEPLPADVWRQVEQLPPIHRDPTDRILVGHARELKATIATADNAMRRYPVPLAW